MASSFTDAAGHELQPLCAWQSLYLKPIAKIEITVLLPKVTTPGQSVSNWDLMERLKKAIFPIQLDPIKVRESSLEVVIFDAELQTRLLMKKAMKILDNLTMKVPGFSKPLTVKVAGAKSDFPCQHDWDIYYTHNKLDENSPGERPDTIYLEKIPVKWFNDGIVEGPSEVDFKKAMEVYGHIRMIDIPYLDPVRKFMDPKFSGVQTKGFGFGQDVFFEAYVQYAEYKGFATAMDALRNMKWVKKIDGRYFQANVKVAFDTTRHLSNAMILQRDEERRKIITEKRSKMEQEQRDKEDEERRHLETHKRAREEEHRRRERLIEKREKLKQEDEESRAAEKDAERQARARRIIESQRLVDYLFKSIQIKEDRRIKIEEAKLKESLRKVEQLEEDQKKEEMLRATLLKQRELRIRERLKEKMSSAPSNSRSPGPSSSFFEDSPYRPRSRSGSRSTTPSSKRSESKSSSASTFERVREKFTDKKRSGKGKERVKNKKHKKKKHRKHRSRSGSSSRSRHEKKRRRSD